VLSNYAEASLLKKQEELYASLTQAHKFKSSKLYPANKGSKVFNSTSLFSKDGFPNAPLISKKNYLPIHNESTLDSLDESYESFKNFSLNIFRSGNPASSELSYSTSPHNYTRVIDPFRADYEDTLWGFDGASDSNGTSSETASDFLDSRVSNPMKLRSTARNANISYSAMQKVFKSRLDEGRSHSRLSDFSNSYVSHNFITTPKSGYGGMLSKNGDSFFDVNLYSPDYSSNFSLLSSVYNSLNSTLIDVPFLISAKSDPSRYLWFD
jgi:hypothetical protein